VCHAESTHPSIRYVNEEELEVAIQSREKPLVIDLCVCCRLRHSLHGEAAVSWRRFFGGFRGTSDGGGRIGSDRLSSPIAHPHRTCALAHSPLIDRNVHYYSYATWCGPCVMLSKELEQVAEQLGDKVDILKIDTDQNEGISNALQIQGLPTLIFVSTSNDKPALRTEGLLPAQSIIEIVLNEL
jgi:thiol-disulfide isomerase/thioredoxin